MHGCSWGVGIFFNWVMSVPVACFNGSRLPLNAAVAASVNISGDLEAVERRLVSNFSWYFVQYNGQPVSVRTVPSTHPSIYR